MQRRHTSEHGYILLGLLFMTAVILIALAAAAPHLGTSIKRDREEELVRRGKQYQRAIQLYYRKFGRFPNSLTDLEKTNNIRFLRKKYTDPITGSDEWKLIRFGQSRPRSVPSYLSGGQSGGMGSGMGPGGPGAGPGIGSSAASISRPLSGSPTLGGGPIVGVASTSEKESLKEIDGKNHYHEWEFVYDPSLDAGARQMPGNERGPRTGREGGTPQPQPQPLVPPSPQRPQ